MEESLLGLEGREASLKERIWVEIKKISRIALPAILSRVTSFGIFVVTQAFLGHISEVELAGYALVQTITVRFANGLILGMSSATETMCGQAFGAKQYHMMGIYLQRSWIINLIIATLLLPVFIFGAPIFKFLGQDEEIANAAGKISLWFIPVTYYFIFTLTIQKYLQAQLKNMVYGWFSLASFITHVILTWLFVSKLNFGVPGAMVAMIISCGVLVCCGFSYLLGGWCDKTWTGFSVAAFHDLWPATKLSMSSGVMLCLELWYNAVLVLLAGYMQNATVAISAFSISLNITTWELMICLGFLAASSVRVSNELGRGDAKATKFSIKVITCLSLLVGVVFWLLSLIFGGQLGQLFTSEKQVIDAISDLSVLLAFTILINSVQTIFTGVAVGAGHQSMVAIVNIVCYYLVGIPIGVILGYVCHLQVKGIWIGLLIGVLSQSSVLGFITARTNWEEQVNKTSERLNKWYMNEASIKARTEEKSHQILK